MPIWKIREMQKSSTLSFPRFTDAKIKARRILQHQSVCSAQDPSRNFPWCHCSTINSSHFTPSLPTLAHSRGGKREHNDFSSGLDTWARYCWQNCQITIPHTVEIASCFSTSENFDTSKVIMFILNVSAWQGCASVPFYNKSSTAQ